MSSSWSCEQELRKLASELYTKAAELERAADAICALREESGIIDKIKEAKDWARNWLNVEE